MPLTAPSAALALYIKLLRASRSVFAAVEGSTTASGLTVTQFAVLEALLHKGPLSHGALCDKVLTSPANLTDVIDKLQARKLVDRTRAEADARRVTVALTQAGHAAIAAAFPEHAKRIEAVVASALSPAEQQVLAGLLRRLGLAAQDLPPR